MKCKWKVQKMIIMKLKATWKIKEKYKEEDFQHEHNIYFLEKKCSFHTYYNVHRTGALLQNYSNFSQISTSKSVNTRFANLTFCCSLLPLKAVFQGVSKNTRIDAQIKVKLKLSSIRKLAEEKMVERLLQQITKTNYKLQLLVSECGFRNFCHLGYLYYCYSDPKLPAEFKEIKTIST